VCLATLGSFATTWAAPRPAWAQSAEDRAKRHFKSGVNLYTDKNYAGAIAEFEAAYRLKPGASSLKNIALCQKGLFRYAEAADTLQLALKRHGAELAEEERKAIEAAIEEFSSLVGSIVVRTNVPTARISLDGRVLTAAELSSALNVNVGEHTVVADAPGFARASRTLRVAGGQKNQPVDLTLTPVTGFISVRAQNPEDAIGLDGKGMSFGSYSGPVAPGRHVLQVYRQGFKSFDQSVVIELGKTIEITAPELLPDEDAPPPAVPGAPPVITPQVRGWYGLLTLTGLGLRNDPENLDIDNASVSGAAIGVRAGYRLWTPIAVELMLDSSRHDIKGACDLQVERGRTERDCNTSAFERKFQLDSFRLGPNLRIMSGGDTLRFTSALGAGAVRHQIDLEAPDQKDPDASVALPAGEAKGWDPYFMLEVGAQYNWGHVVFELDAIVMLDGASNTVGSFSDGKSWAPFEETGGLIMGGLGLRVGWSEWTPDSSKPKTP
jgi:hypothetical protein